jgi:2-C-methyl-D-erythritol 4-phosphate cytidylyltransferase
MTHAIIVAAGDGKRAGGTTPAGAACPAGGNIKKQFAEIAGDPVIARALAPFEASHAIDTIVCVIAKEDIPLFENLMKRYPISKIQGVVEGGACRQDSVFAGISFLEERYPKTDWVAVHDGARPFVTSDLIERVVAAASPTAGAIAALPVTDTVKRVDPNHQILASIPRDQVWAAQTPQVFPLGLLAEALRSAQKEQFIGTDEASLFERMGQQVLCVAGEIDNIKITTLSDFHRGERIIRARLA